MIGSPNVPVQVRFSCSDLLGHRARTSYARPNRDTSVSSNQRQCATIVRRVGPTGAGRLGTIPRRWSRAAGSSRGPVAPTWRHRGRCPGPPTLVPGAWGSSARLPRHSQAIPVGRPSASQSSTSTIGEVPPRSVWCRTTRSRARRPERMVYATTSPTGHSHAFRKVRGMRVDAGGGLSSSARTLSKTRALPLLLGFSVPALEVRARPDDPERLREHGRLRTASAMLSEGQRDPEDPPRRQRRPKFPYSSEGDVCSGLTPIQLRACSRCARMRPATARSTAFASR